MKDNKEKYTSELVAANSLSEAKKQIATKWGVDPIWVIGIHLDPLAKPARPRIRLI